MHLPYSCFSCQGQKYLFRLCCQIFICRKCLFNNQSNYQCFICKKPLIRIIQYIRNGQIQKLNQQRLNYYSQHINGIKMNQQMNIYQNQQNCYYPYQQMQNKKISFLNQSNLNQNYEEIEFMRLAKYVNHLLIKSINQGVFPLECDRNSGKKQINRFCKGNYQHEKRKNFLFTQDIPNLKSSKKNMIRSHSAYLPNVR